MAANNREGDIILRIQNLTKSFGGLTAVNNASLALNQGDLHCLIGPNGAGKSTFLKLITGQIQPDSGLITYRGEDITSTDRYLIPRLGIGFKFQSPNLYLNMTVEDNLRIPVQRVRPLEEIEARITELLDLTSLEHRRTDRAEDLSHGEKQWLEIAMTIAIEPEVVLLDEPTAGMTSGETKKTGHIIEDLIDAGKTVMVVEHDIDFVRKFSDQATFMHNGEFLAEGKMKDLEKNEEIQKTYLGKKAGDSV